MSTKDPIILKLNTTYPPESKLFLFIGWDKERKKERNKERRKKKKKKKRRKKTD
jgi:hypothetical protein